MKFLLTIPIVCFSILLHGQIEINEIMSRNSGALVDEFGESSDWMEFVNTCDCPINMSGWALTDDYDADDIETDELWFFPDTTVLANQYFLVLASGLEFPQNTEFLHANFKLKGSGEEVALLKPNMTLEDEVPFPCIPENKSYGRVTADAMTHFHVSSPGSENISSAAYDQLSTDIILSHPSGFYDQAIDINVSSSSEAEIRFSSDGAQPDESSGILTSSLTVSENYVFDQSLSIIPTALSWDEPQTDVFRGETFKFLTYAYGCPSSELVSANYFVHPNHEELFPFPVVSITLDSSELFGDSGIYVPGITGENYFRSGDDWEKDGHFDYFNAEKNLELSQPISMRTRGRGSRANRQKSLKLYAKDAFGKDWFDYKFFDQNDLTSFRKIVLRSGHSDFTEGMIKDVVSAELVRDLDLDFMDSNPVTVFINGEYWGIHFLRENLSQHFISTHYDIPADNIDIIKNNNEVTDGTAEAFDRLIDAVNSTSSYDDLATLIDIDNFIDYNISQIYLSNWDWPFNNVKAWRHQTDTAKFRWLFFDCDACLYKSSLENFKQFDTSDEVSIDYRILQKLLSFEPFRTKFNHRFIELIQTDFNPDRVISMIDSLEHLLEPVMEQHIQRWSIPSSVQVWKNSLDEMRSFALQRPIYMLQILETHFNQPTILLYPNPSSDFISAITPFKDETYAYEIIDLQGKLKDAGMLEQSPVDISGLDQGLYLFKVYYRDLVFTERFQKL